LKGDGTLVIPMWADPKYHWWKQGGQTVRRTMEEWREALHGQRDGVQCPSIGVEAEPRDNRNLKRRRTGPRIAGVVMKSQ